MSGSYDVMGAQETGLTRAQIISAMVQRAVREKAQSVPTVMDVSAQAVAGAKSIDFMRRSSSFTVENLAEEAEADVQTYQFTPDNLPFNQHAVISWFIKKRSAVQSALALEADAIQEAAAEHAIDVDRKIIAALVAGAASANNVSVTGAMTKAKFLEAKAKLQKSTRLNPRNAKFTLLLGSDREAEMLDIPGFVEADKLGNANVISSGQLGRYFGVNTLVTDEPVLGANTALMYIDLGFAYGNQMDPDLTSAVQPKKVGTEYALDQLYGTKVLNNGIYISKITFS